MKESGCRQGLPRPGVGQPDHARPDAQAGHGGARGSAPRSCIARPASRWPRSSSSATRARASPPSRRPSRWRLSLPLDEISFNVPMPLPGSRLFERLGAPDEGKDWTRENEVTFVYPVGDRRGVAAAQDRRDDGGVRAAAAACGGARVDHRRREGRLAATGGGAREAGRYLSSRNSPSVGRSKSLSGGRRRAAQPPLHLELRRGPSAARTTSSPPRSRPRR